MEVGDRWEIRSKVGSRNGQNFIYGNKSVFTVTILEANSDMAPWPNTDGADPILPSNTSVNNSR